MSTKFNSHVQGCGLETNVRRLEKTLKCGQIAGMNWEGGQRANAGVKSITTTRSEIVVLWQVEKVNRTRNANVMGT